MLPITGEHRAISSQSKIAGQSGAGALLLLFPAGHRPNLMAIRQMIAEQKSVSISHDPSETTNFDRDRPEEGWVELLCEGLTFDLIGLAAAPPITVPDAKQLTGDISLILDGNVEAIALQPGPHLKGGGSSLPIFRTLMALGATFSGSLESCNAILWPESSCVTPVLKFEQAIDQWLAGGAFPVPALVSFRETMDRGYQSHGLAFFTGQELRLEPDLLAAHDDTLRLGARLVGQLVLSGTIDVADQFTGPDGSSLRLEPSRNGRFVRVLRG